MKQQTGDGERDMTGANSPHFALPTNDADLMNQNQSVPAWEEVAAGRFMPRRTRGSCVGRALG